MPTPADNVSFPRAVQVAHDSPAFMADLSQLYADADAAVRQRNATCMGGGTCCRFDVAGHRLYVSTGELAYLLCSPWPVTAVFSLRCPYQVGPLCRARDHRPLGCRTYFCRTAITDSLDAIYERVHQQIQALHDRHGVPYYYVELSAGLAECIPPQGSE